MSAAALVGSLILAASPGSADPAGPPADPSGKPTIQEVKTRVDSLNHQAEIASEQLNTVREQMQAAQKRFDALQADVDRKTSRVAKLRSQVVGAALSDYQNAGGLSSTTSFLVADDPGKFMDDMATKAMVQHQQTGLLTKLTQQQRQLGIQEQQAQREVDAIERDKQLAAHHQATLDEKTASAQDLLDQLEADQLARLQAMQAQQTTTTTTTTYEPPSRSAPRVNLSDVPASERAKVAVQTALDQIGDPYVYGAAGPDSFDCSGLTMYAWAAAGVSIPHASSMQPGAGTPVSLDSLMPGDLVFYYSPISHVGMYIGNGNIVHAPHTGSYVEIVPLYSMPVSCAVRIG
ncbi:MAG: NlpC/P60 family protein [Nocardioidaceae bacterium]